MRRGGHFGTGGGGGGGGVGVYMWGFIVVRTWWLCLCSAV